MKFTLAHIMAWLYHLLYWGLWSCSCTMCGVSHVLPVLCILCICLYSITGSWYAVWPWYQLSCLALCWFFAALACHWDLKPHFRSRRSGSSIFCGHQCWDHTVQADYSRGGRLLELPAAAGRAGPSLHPACVLPEEVAKETRVVGPCLRFGACFLKVSVLHRPHMPDPQCTNITIFTTNAATTSSLHSN